MNPMNANLLQSIEEGMPSFSKGQKMIASYILEHYEKAAYLTASRLGALVGVSESTVRNYQRMHLQPSRLQLRQ